MERHATSAELKARAKGQLLGKYGTIIPAILIVEIIMFAITSVITLPLDTRTMPGLIVSFIIECLLQLFAGIFIAGQTYLYLNISCGGNIRVSDVFYGFTHHPDKAILIQLYQLLLMLASFVPLFLLLALWMVIDSLYMLIPITIAFCFGLVASVIISLMYSQSYFVMLDFPDFSAVQCLRFSRKIMKGSKTLLSGCELYPSVSAGLSHLLHRTAVCDSLYEHHLLQFLSGADEQKEWRERSVRMMRCQICAL